MANPAMQSGDSQHGASGWSGQAERCNYIIEGLPAVIVLEPFCYKDANFFKMKNECGLIVDSDTRRK